MDRLSLVLDLRKALWDISQTGGDTSLYVPKNYPRLSELRRFVFNLSKGQKIPYGRNRSARRYLSLSDLLERNNFERYVTYCTIRLHDFGVPEEDHDKLLKQALSRIISGVLSDPQDTVQELSDANPHGLSENIDFKEIVASKLTDCFLPWYYPTFILVYEILEEHMLAFWDFENIRWQSTNLGRYALRLNAFSLLTFLISIEINFTRSLRYRRYPTEETLTHLLNEPSREKEDRNRHSRGRNPVALSWYGILDNTYRDRDELTDFGRQLLLSVLENKARMKDLILMLVEAGDKGFEITPDDSTIQECFEFSREVNLLSASQEASISQMSADYDRGDYLGSLTRFYPLIEGFIDSELRRRGVQTKPNSGMGAKLTELVKCQAISNTLGSWGEIVNSRNKIVHGNITDNEKEVLKPLLAIVANFWFRLLSELSTTTTI